MVPPKYLFRKILPHAFYGLLILVNFIGNKLFGQVAVQSEPKTYTVLATFGSITSHRNTSQGK